MPVRASRSSGGGSYRGGGGGLGGGRPPRVDGSSYASSGGKPPPMLTVIPRKDGSGYIYRHAPAWEGGEVVYNRMDRESRWNAVLRLAKERCPEDPKSDNCQMMIELLVDLPPGTLEEHGLPQRLRPDIHLNDPPLRIPEPPPTPCQIYTKWLQSCRNRNTHYDAQWMCVPLEAFVEDDCSSDQQKA